MHSLRTLPPEWYLPPSRSEIAKSVKKQGLIAYSPALVEDLANMAAGGVINPFENIREALELEATQGIAKFPAESDLDFQKRLREEIARFIKYQEAVQEFLEELDVNQMPGFTPLEKAVGWLKLLATQRGGEFSGNGVDEILLPIFLENGNGTKLARLLEEAVGNARELDHNERELLLAARPAGSAKLPFNQLRELAEEMLRGRDVIARISRQLDDTELMDVAKSITQAEDNAGDERRNRPIKDLGELNRLAIPEWCYPRNYLRYRLMTNQAMIRERTKRVVKKQLLYLLIDGSGSMEGPRIARAGGVLMNRLRAVMAGEAEVYVRFFDYDLHPEHKVRTKAEAKKAMKFFQETANFSGGGTDITNAILGAHERIEQLMKQGLHHRPEIAIVTDGQDHKVSYLTASQFPGTRLHSFIIDQDNPSLVDLAKSTGGVAMSNL